MESKESNGFVEIPAHGSETHHSWPQHPQIFSDAQISRQKCEYQSAVVPSIAKWSPNFLSSLMSELEEANDALRLFAGHTIRLLGN